MSAMPTAVRRAFDTEMDAARNHPDNLARWSAAERAHILSQPWSWPHSQVHGRMLRLAVADRNRREALGQLVRLVVAAPGSATGRYPLGNTGRADVGLTEPMPMPDDLRALLSTEAEPTP